MIIPAYNEAAGISNTLAELCLYLPENYDIIVIDDGSTDDTYTIVLDMNLPQVRVIRHKRNQGYGSAIKTGCKAASGDIIVWYDADGQHRPKDVFNVVNTLVKENLDYCIGVRTSDSFVENNRKIGKKILSWTANVLAKEPMDDVNSGMRAFKRKILMRHISLLPERFGASTVTSFIMQEMNYNGGGYPIVVRKRKGESTVKPFKDGIGTLCLIMNIILLFRAKQVFTTLAVFFITIGSVYGVINAFADRLGIPVLAAILVIFGMQIYFFGMISAQISALRLEHFDAEL